MENGIRQAYDSRLPSEIIDIILDDLFEPYDLHLDKSQVNHRCYCFYHESRMWDAESPCLPAYKIGYWKQDTPITSMLYVCKALSPLAIRAFHKAFTGVLRLENLIYRSFNCKMPDLAPERFWQNIWVIKVSTIFSQVCYGGVFHKFSNVSVFESSKLTVIQFDANKSARMDEFVARNHVRQVLRYGSQLSASLFSLLLEMGCDQVFEDKSALYSWLLERKRSHVTLAKCLEIRTKTGCLGVLSRLSRGPPEIVATCLESDPSRVHPSETYYQYRREMTAYLARTSAEPSTVEESRYRAKKGRKPLKVSSKFSNKKFSREGAIA